MEFVIQRINSSKNAIPLPLKLIYCLWIGLIFGKCFDFKLLSSIFAAKSIYYNLQQICCRWGLGSLTKICIIWMPSSTNTQTSNWRLILIQNSYHCVHVIRKVRFSWWTYGEKSPWYCLLNCMSRSVTIKTWTIKGASSKYHLHKLFQHPLLFPKLQDRIIYWF